VVDASAVPIKGRVARFIAVDVCGNPISGGTAAGERQIITKGFIQVQIEPQYEDGESHRQRLADGSLCVSDDDDDEFTMAQVTIQLCGVCPSIAEVVSGARLLTGGTPVSGTGAAYGEGANTKHFALEVWQNVTGRGACDATGAQRYVYWAIPNLHSARISSALTIENNGLTVELQAKSDAVGGTWGDGPGSLGPWAPTFAEGEHFLWNITTVAPPTIPANCGYTTIT
jgi:hypothetical protein